MGAAGPKLTAEERRNPLMEVFPAVYPAAEQAALVEQARLVEQAALVEQVVLAAAVLVVGLPVTPMRSCWLRL